MTRDPIEARTGWMTPGVEYTGPVVVTAPWRGGSCYTVLGYHCSDGDEITIVRGDICKIVTGQERAAIAVCRWLAGSARADSDHRPK